MAAVSKDEFLPCENPVLQNQAFLGIEKTHYAMLHKQHVIRDFDDYNDYDHRILKALDNMHASNSSRDSFILEELHKSPDEAVICRSYFTVGDANAINLMLIQLRNVEKGNIMGFDDTGTPAPFTLEKMKP